MKIENLTNYDKIPLHNCNVLGCILTSYAEVLCLPHKRVFVLDWLATITHIKNMDHLYWKCIVEYNTENNTHIPLSRSNHWIQSAHILLSNYYHRIMFFYHKIILVPLVKRKQFLSFFFNTTNCNTIACTCCFKQYQ